jgi:predicted NBD/HSP70 family sugar kinase
MRSRNSTNSSLATSETARDINRSVVLNLIRRQPISRADLARVSGLQRSTVSLITEQLISEKWILKGPMGRLPRGRRPTFLPLNDHRAIFVVDLRPDRTTVAVADVNGRFLSEEAVDTPSDPKAAVEILCTRIRHQIRLHRDLTYEGIGVSLPGCCDESTRRVVFTPNLKWPEFELAGPLEEATGLRVEMENAANACVLAEEWFGHVEKARDLVVVTVSEGVGTGISMNGHLVRGAKGTVGEFGHAPLDPNGPLCGCGARGCWEVYASNRAALRYYHESQATSSDMSFEDLLALAELGDALALRALDKMADGIARGMRMIVVGLAPQDIVFVGDFTRQWARFAPVIEGAVETATLVGKPPRSGPRPIPGWRACAELWLWFCRSTLDRYRTPPQESGSRHRDGSPGALCEEGCRFANAGNYFPAA